MTVLFNKDVTLFKQSDTDVVMESYDTADVCDLVGMYILDILGKMFISVFFGINKNDVLAISTPGRLRKNLIRTLSSVRRKVTIETHHSKFPRCYFRSGISYIPALSRAKQEAILYWQSLLTLHYSFQEPSETCKWKDPESLL